MRKPQLLAIIALSGVALSWSCSSLRSGRGGAEAPESAAPEPKLAYTFLGVTSDCRGEMFPCG
jgi:hypothetical protein